MKRFAYIFLVFSAVVTVAATSAYDHGTGPERDPVHEEPDRPVLADTTAGRLSGNVTLLDSVFYRMKEVRKNNGGTVRILHIGDSHIQAGFFPDTVRRSLQEQFGNSGRGLIVPLRLAGTNEPPDYVIKSPDRWAYAKASEWNPSFEVGLGGVAISTAESETEFVITCRRSPFSKITAFHHPMAPLLVEDSLYSLGMECDFYGTDMTTNIFLNQTTDSINLRASVTDPEYNTPTFYGFSLENGQSGILYHSAGVNGCSYEHYNRSPQIMEQYALLDPDLIIVSLGTNDSFGRFSEEKCRESIVKFISSLQKHCPDAKIMLTTPMECYTRRAVNKNIALVRQTIITAANDTGLPYWDMYEAAGGKGSIDRWYREKLAQRDHIHLTREGYGKIGHMMYMALMNSYNEYLSQLQV